MNSRRHGPIIILGMHRSGTSMVSRLLQRLGVFMGWELDANAEAVYFVRRNREILESQGARWDRPDPIDELLDHEALCERLVSTLEVGLSVPSVASYLGPARYLRYRSLRRFDRPWGWKDPRNTLLLRLWLEVFPDARVIHVVRNGMDVARSLARREARRLEYVLHEGNRARTFLRLLGSPPEGCGRVAWAFSQVRLRLARERLHRQFCQLHVHPILDPAVGLELWGNYVSRAETDGQSARAGFLRVRYEDILEDPPGELERLAEFVGLSIPEGRLTPIATLVEPPPDSASESDPLTEPMREAVRPNRWLREFGYEDAAERDPRNPG